MNTSTDPQEAFKDDDLLYPTEDEMSHWQTYSGDYISGMPGIANRKMQFILQHSLLFLFLYFFGLVFVGIVGSITEIKLNYGKECEGKQQCIVKFEIEKNTYGPFFLYYELNWFYTRYFDFAQSISPQQMKGSNELTDEEYDVYCPDIQSFKSLQRHIGFNKNLNKKVNPCGVAAKFIFNDSFLLFYVNTETVSAGIAYSVDLDYKQIQNSQFSQWLDHVDGTNSLFLIFNLYYMLDMIIIYQKEHIVLQLKINNYENSVLDYPTLIFGGEKYLIVTNLSYFGSKYFSLGYLLIATPGVQLISALVVYIKHRIVEKKQKYEQKIHADLKLKEKSD